MLLRSSSSPILNSWLPNSSGSSPEPENLPQLTRTRSVSLAASFSIEDGLGRSSPTRTAYESDLKDLAAGCKKEKVRILRPRTPKLVKVKEDKQEEMGRLLSTSGLGLGEAVSALEEGCAVVEEKEKILQTLVVGGGSIGGSGGKVCGGGGGGGGGRDGSGFGSDSQDSNSWHGHDSTDAYYQKMIEANPGNSLLLANYAKFLKQVTLFRCTDTSLVHVSCLLLH